MTCKECLAICERENGQGEFVCPCGSCGCEMTDPDLCFCEIPCWIIHNHDDPSDTTHAMTLDGALWRCRAGHETEAAPAVVMSAAGMEPMI